ncbi:MAG: aminoacyl-tRNA hydrolase [Candidatus Portnoybacteria bacterium RIFCSPLOWO2_02_FULL_39_11]|uniref:Peptidyl-tRNA hydrolase n=1 Tax=Candidatus Portnoybacteria bacterium RIFCSPLOWO2_02_FULL_39_11 TaxID=1802001 RepID=A0A1G2FW29_9BACT|nr:MAG: aminoacyl-tRNA hydrolase [Candidatus Portnoybacteria bacterium RIFCSPLOWO2_02_FULL_39_11]
MKLIIGLGNPGPQYFNTRHNFGWLALNYLQDSLPGFSIWETSDKFKALISEGQIGNEKIILVKPQTFMNNSGQTVKLLADFYKIDPSDILILHDDLDLTLGQIRVSQNISAGGHKGVASIIEKLGTKNFARLRLGIKPEKQSFLSKFLSPLTQRGAWGVKTSAEKFVLQKFSEKEREIVQQTTQKTKEAILLILKDGLTAAQNKFN